MAQPRKLRVLAVCVAILMGSATVLAPIAMADDLRDKKNKVRGQIRGAQGELHESSRAAVAAGRRLERSRALLAGAQRRLGVAQANLTVAAQQDAAMQAKLVEAERQLAVAREELKKAKAAVVESRRRIGALAASNYANGDPALMGLVVILNSQNPAEATTSMNTVDSLMSRQTNELEELREAQAELVLKETKVELAKEDVAAQRKAAAANLVRTTALRVTAAQVQSQVAALVSKNRAAEAAALRARRADLARLRALKKQENRIKRLIMQRARKQKGGYTGGGSGFLYRPVPGPVTSPYGYRRHPIYGYWGLHDGTDFRAPCGTAMRAAHSGTVISRYYSDVYGSRLYIDVGRFNGRNMTVVYNHASGYRVGVGERVGRGEVVGYSGSSGWSTACHLHFTVLLNGNPTDPMNYM